MKKIVLSALALLMGVSAMADEGMWLLPYLKKMNAAEMAEKGLQISVDDIYNSEGGSIKDAIVIFGRGCTGEIVSPNGLLFTNHHCGYGSIQSLSSVEHDYLKNGFWAMSEKEEIPAPGLTVQFVREIKDVTAEILGNVPNIAAGAEREKLVGDNISALQKSMKSENPGMDIIVRSFFGGNQYFAFAMETYKDVRLVGTPPTSIGKFGGDTDNWMWPRHTGDFAIFRVYAGKDNRPAEYSADNVPYKADDFLKISTAGYKEGDFSMIMGFPGSTQRYMTSHEIDYMLEVDNPQRIFIRGERQDILSKEMAASDKVRIQYASKYAGSSNYWKNSIGMSRGIKRLDVKGKKQAQEHSFQKWAQENTMPQEGFIDALSKIESSVESAREKKAAFQYIREALTTSVEIMRPTQIVEQYIKSDKTEADKERATESLEAFYKDFSWDVDHKVAHRMFEIVKENAKDLPSVFADVIDTKYKGNTQRYVNDLYSKSNFTTLDKALALLNDPSQKKLDKDPAYILAESVMKKLGELSSSFGESNKQFADGHRQYIKGLMMQNPDKAWASDANFTIRLTYGSVLPYDPADAVTYDYYTTLGGVIEKEDPTNPVEFTVPEKLKELFNTKDFGAYANSEGELPVAFLADCDITGGNSGSPILNSKGELIGLAFDGNWEAMSGDVAFEPELQRTISVDVRYLLFIIDKFADADWLLDEMVIVND